MKKLVTLVRLALVLSSTMTVAFSGTTYTGEDVGPSPARETGASLRVPSTAAPQGAPGDGDLILLRAETIDTSRYASLDTAEIQSGLSLMGLDPNDAAYYLVQFQGPVQDEWKTSVRQAGGRLFGFVPNHAFTVKMNDAIAQRVAALPEVKWVGLYHPVYKVAPRLTAEAGLTSEPIAVTVMTFEPSAVEEVASAIKGLGGQVLDSNSGPRWGLIRAEVQPATLPDIARLVEVSWVERFVPPRISNDVARGAELMNVDVVHQTHGLTGAGQIIGHADSGLDVGDTATIHPDFQGRIRAAYAWGRRAPRIVGSFDSPDSAPMGLAWDGAFLWHIDRSSDTLYKLDTSGNVVDSCQPPSAASPTGLTWDGANLWYADYASDEVYRIDTSCNELDSFASPGATPEGLAWDGTHLWHADDSDNTIYKLDISGGIVDSFPSPGTFPTGLEWDGSHLWHADGTAERIYKIDTSGNVVESFDSPGSTPRGLAWDGTSLWSADSDDDAVYTIDLIDRVEDWSDPHGHGTHSAASILGSGAASGGQYKGAAPGSELVHQSVMDSSGGLGGIPLDTGELFSQAYDEAARIHSDSWGADVDGEYTVDAASCDAFMWDNKDMLVVFSAGNAGRDANDDGVVDPDSIGSPATAKNVLSVGASENNRPTIDSTWGSSRFRVNPIRDDRRADDISGLAAFSSRGPTDDGRMKPDVVAPGTFIISARSQQWPFDDDFESTLVSTSSSSPDAVSQHARCEPRALTGREVVYPEDWQWNRLAPDLTLVACTAERDRETEDEMTDPAALSAEWTATGNWQLVTSDHHTPDHAWANEGYAQSADDRLTSPALDVPIGSDVLGFWTRYDLEDGDKGIVYFSDDGGDVWVGYSFTGSQPSWTYRWFPVPWGVCWIEWI
jgi:subtilisin family serine protease